MFLFVDNLVRRRWTDVEKVESIVAFNILNKIIEESKLHLKK